MQNMVEEFFLVLAYSRRTRVALLLGPIFFIAILLFGANVVGGIQFHGVLATLTDPIRDALLGRYEKAAWGVLGMFLVLAIRNYRRDRERALRG